MESNLEGLPYVLYSETAVGGSGKVWAVLAWSDTAWAHSFASDQLSFGFLETTLSTTDRRYLVNPVPEHQPPVGPAYMVIAEVMPDRIAPADTAFSSLDTGGEWDGAASARRRWVVRTQQRQPCCADTRFHVRTAYSDTTGIWHEVQSLGIDEDHCAIAPLSDTTAMVAYAGESGLAWAKLDGSGWTEQGVLDPRPWTAQHPRFAFRRSGGLWLLWTGRGWVHVSLYRDGRWFYGDSLKAVHPEGGTFVPAWCDPSLDGGERPVLAWGDLAYGYTLRADVGSVSFPTDSGWAQGEEIPGSDNMFLTPFVARDRNGDAWLSWQTREQEVRWTHTYVSATTSAPRVVPTPAGRRVSWTLSEPAPESWWMVLRSIGSTPYEEAVRIQAGSTVELDWTDSITVPDSVRYRIRRESVDKRYEWLSPESRFLPRGRPPLRFTAVPTPYREGALLVLQGAAPGAIDLRLYDLQGRQVLHETAVGGGSGEDGVRLVFPRSPGAGVFFLRARDSTGNESRVVRLVVLR